MCFTALPASEGWSHDLPKQSHGIAVNFEGNVVEDAKIGQHQELVPDFPRDSLLRPRGGLIAVLSMSHGG